MDSIFRLTFLRLATLVISGMLWIIGDYFQLFNPTVLPPIQEVGSALIAVLAMPEFLPAFMATLLDSLKGVIYATLIAVPAGIIIGMFPAIEKATRILLDFGRSFPVVALMPIFVLIIGATSQMKVVMVTIACFFPILLQTIYGARRLEPTIMDTVHSYRIPFYLRFSKVILPSALPFISTGIKIAISISILVSVSTEIINQIDGLGAQINLSRTFNEVDIAYAYVIYAGLLGVALTTIWDQIDAVILRWHRLASREN